MSSGESNRRSIHAIIWLRIEGGLTPCTILTTIRSEFEESHTRYNNVYAKGCLCLVLRYNQDFEVSFPDNPAK